MPGFVLFSPFALSSWNACSITVLCENHPEQEMNFRPRASENHIHHLSCAREIRDYETRVLREYWFRLEGKSSTGKNMHIGTGVP